MIARSIYLNVYLPEKHRLWVAFEDRKCFFGNFFEGLATYARITRH